MSEYRFYKRLRYVMQGAKMDIATLAEKSKIKYPTLTNYCRGAYEPKVSDLVSLASALNVSPASLLPEGKYASTKLDTLISLIVDLEELIPGSTQVYIEHIGNWIDTAKENKKD